MKKVQASDARVRLSELLDEVKRGETVIIIRHGRAVARLVPETTRRTAEIKAALDRIMAARKTAGRMTVEEILEARDERGTRVG